MSSEYQYSLHCRGIVQRLNFFVKLFIIKYNIMYFFLLDELINIHLQTGSLYDISAS